MQLTQGFFNLAQRQGELLLTNVITRDNVHLAPQAVPHAIARRLRAGIKVVEAYLRRLILLLALKLELDLILDQSIYVKTHHTERPRETSGSQWHVLASPAPVAWLDQTSTGDMFGHLPNRYQVPIIAMLARLAALKALIKVPDARALKLAHHLRRKHNGPLQPASLQGRGLPARYGTEVSMLYNSFAHAISVTGQARPPPIGPRPRAGPRIRCL